jgi:L-lactate dehydrogenase complex protein LldG
VDKATGDAAVSSGARAEILARIRGPRAAVSPPWTVPPAVTEHEPPVVAIPRDYQGPAAVKGGTNLADLLAERLADYGALVRRVPAAAAPGAIAKELHERAARRIAVPTGLCADWVAALPEPWPDHPRMDIAELAAMDAVITTVTVAVAQTGTLVLDHGPGQGRRELTLVPDVHLALVASNRILAAVPDAVAALDPRSPLTWISGPSATSDIELNRVQGVHGPRTLIVFILDG